MLMRWGRIIAVILLGGVRSFGADSTLPVDDKGGISIPVTVNGHLLNFLVDTGFSVETGILRTVAAKIGIRPETSAPIVQIEAGKIPLSISQPVELGFLGEVFHHTNLAVLDLPAWVEESVQGAIGWAAIKSNIWVFDLAVHRVVAVTKLPEEATQWLKLKVRNDRQVLVLEIPQGDGQSPAVVMIDTGSSGDVALAPERWREWKATQAGSPSTLDSYYEPGSNYVVSEQKRADRLFLGELPLSDVLVEEATSSDVAAGGPGFAGVIGRGGLKRLILAVDAEHGTAYVAIRTGTPASNYNRLGAAFSPQSEGGADLVAHLAEGSPAAKSGIENGDVLVKIGDLAVSAWRTQLGLVDRINDAFNQAAGTNLTLTLKRADQVMQRKVVLQNILSPAQIQSPDDRRAP
jgi:predicted aspartyl protease